MLYEYDPISCIGMKVSTKDGDTTNRYLNAISQEKDKKMAMQLVRQAEQDEDVPEEKLEKIYNKFRSKFGSMKDNKTTKDEEQYYHFKSSEGEEYFGTETDLKNLISHFTPSEKKEWGKIISKTHMTKEQVTKWRNNAMNKLGL